MVAQDRVAGAVDIAGRNDGVAGGHTERQRGVDRRHAGGQRDRVIGAFEPATAVSKARVVGLP